jgi:hypothetical protein
MHRGLLDLYARKLFHSAPVMSWGASLDPPFIMTRTSWHSPLLARQSKLKEGLAEAPAAPWRESHPFTHVSDAPVQTSPAQTYQLSNYLICHQRILLLYEHFEDQLVNRRQISASALQVEKPVGVPPFLSISGAHAGCHVAEKGSAKHF